MKENDACLDSVCIIYYLGARIICNMKLDPHAQKVRSCSSYHPFLKFILYKSLL